MRFRPRAEAGGRRPLLFGAGSAVLLFLAMPGHVGWWPLLFVALVPLLFACLHASPGRSALAGFVCGLLYHLTLLYWILIVLGRYGGLPWWVSLPALVLLAAYMSGFTALFAFLLSLVAGRSWHRERPVAALVWVAPLLWVGLDFLRGMLMSGFPWMDLGYGLFSQPKLIQAADLGGHHLVTFSLVLVNSFVVGIIDRQRRDVRWDIRAERRLLLVACAFLVFIVGYSFMRYRIVTAMVPRSLQAHVAVVQGNIDQAIKWSPETKAATVETYLRLSRSALREADTELVVWPETALPFYPQRDQLIGRVNRFTAEENAWLLTGAPLYALPPEGRVNEPVRYFNGALLIGPGGTISGQYAKRHLVPFGEYVPLRRFLPFLEPLVESIGDFSAGISGQPLTMGSMRLGLLICYESIFPEISRDTVAQGANLLVNLTNDAWYGRSSAPYQSMAMAVFRAVETRRALVRAANTGISGFIDPMGNITAMTPIFTEAALAAAVPLFDTTTVFSRSGHHFGAACLCLTLTLFLFRRRFQG